MLPKEITTIFHNDLPMIITFIIKELAEKIEWQVPCLEKNTEKYIAFSILIEKEVERIG